MINPYANYEWFLGKDLKEFSGQWLAIIDKKVVANGKDVDKVIQKVRKDFPNKKPLITKVRSKISVL